MIATVRSTTHVICETGIIAARGSVHPASSSNSLTQNFDIVKLERGIETTA
jgi:hypothetical protein